jgi:hypothetical protein
VFSLLGQLVGTGRGLRRTVTAGAVPNRVPLPRPVSRQLNDARNDDPALVSG